MKTLYKKDFDKNCVGTKEFIETFRELFLRKKYIKPYPKFSQREILFLTDMLLNKPKNLILFSVADFMADNYQQGVPVFANGPSYRRLQFFKNFILNKGNATKAAIASGYSARSAAQQGHRLLRWIQKAQYRNQSLSGFNQKESS